MPAAAAAASQATNEQQARSNAECPVTPSTLGDPARTADVVDECLAQCARVAVVHVNCHRGVSRVVVGNLEVGQGLTEALPCAVKLRLGSGRAQAEDRGRVRDREVLERHQGQECDVLLRELPQSVLEPGVEVEVHDGLGHVGRGESPAV